MIDRTNLRRPSREREGPKASRARTALILAGIFGVIVAVPSLAVLRVHFDFFRVRLTTED
jgi:hypothetical protein